MQPLASLPLRIHLLLAALCLCGSTSTVAQESSQESGWMGLYIRDLDQRDIQALHLPSEQRGVVVSGVDDEGPAADVGIEPGDVITALDGRAVGSRADFVDLLGDRRAGDRVRLQIVRQNAARQVSFALQTRPRVMQGSRLIDPADADSPLSAEPFRERIVVMQLEDEYLAGYFGLPPRSGVLVLHLVGDAFDRLHPGDVIIECGESTVRTVEQLEEQWTRTREDVAVVLRVVRRGRERTVRLAPDAPTPSFVSALPAAVARQDPATQTWERLLREIDALQARLQALESEVQERAQR